MVRKLSDEELIERINSYDKIKFYKDMYVTKIERKDKYPNVVLNNGYKLKLCNPKRSNPFNLSPFLDKEYGAYNLKLWLKDNRPHMRLVDENIKIYNCTKLRLYSTEWNMEFTMTIYEIINFKSPKNDYVEKSISAGKLSEQEFNDRVNVALQKDCYKDWILISTYSDYHSNSTRLIFKHKTEGWFSSRRLCDLYLDTELSLFHSKARELSTLNMKNYLIRHMRHIKLIDGQMYTKKQGIYKLKCKFHGEFEVNWHNFYARRQDCPMCTKESHSRGEMQVREILDRLGIKYKTELTFKGFKSENGGLYRFDFGIYVNNVLMGIIEYHGQQHYNQYYGFFDGRLSDIQKRDKIKKEYIINDKKLKYLEIKYNDNKKDVIIKNFCDSLAC